jgi:hypothetical protein
LARAAVGDVVRDRAGRDVDGGAAGEVEAAPQALAAAAAAAIAARGGVVGDRAVG